MMEERKLPPLPPVEKARSPRDLLDEMFPTTSSETDEHETNVGPLQRPNAGLDPLLK